MENFDANAGTNKLANVLSDRMRRENDTSLCLDFGEIQGNGSLITNTFPVAIPKGQYSVCRHVGGLSFTTSGGKHGGHDMGLLCREHSFSAGRFGLVKNTSFPIFYGKQVIGRCRHSIVCIAQVGENHFPERNVGSSQCDGGNCG